MKVDKTDRPKRTEPVAGGYARSRPPDAVAPASPAAVSASVLGIPEPEFTPRVREAIMTLMHEVDRLRREVEQARAKLEDLARTADQDSELSASAFLSRGNRVSASATRSRSPACRGTYPKTCSR